MAAIAAAFNQRRSNEADECGAVLNENSILYDQRKVPMFARGTSMRGGLQRKATHLEIQLPTPTPEAKGGRRVPWPTNNFMGPAGPGMPTLTAAEASFNWTLSAGKSVGEVLRNAAVDDGMKSSAARAHEPGKQAHRRRMYVVDPRNSQLVGRWDLSVAVALIFTAIVTPVEVGFLEPSRFANEPLFILNRIVDFFFAGDLVLQVR